MLTPLYTTSKPTVRQRTAGDPQAAAFLFISPSSPPVFRLDPGIHDPDCSRLLESLQCFKAADRAVETDEREFA